MVYRVIRRSGGDVSTVRNGMGEVCEYETREQAQTMADMMNRAEKLGGARYVYSVAKTETNNGRVV